MGGDMTAALHAIHRHLSHVAEPTRGSLVESLVELLAAAGQREAVERVREWGREDDRE